MSSSSNDEATSADFETAQRAEAIALAAATFPALGPFDADTLLDLVEAELGDRAALDDGFRSYGKASRSGVLQLHSRAIAPACVLHIVAGNTPLAGLQSLIRGLLLGSENLVKLPSDGLDEIDAFVAALPEELRSRVTLSRQLPDDWIKRASAIVVFGNDETIHHFRRQARTDQIFIAHGHAISLAVVFSNDDESAAEHAARDVGLFNQQGCLSPHDIYIDESDASGNGVNGRKFAADLAAAMEQYEKIDPRGDISAGESADITALRDSYRFRAANDDRVEIWQSETGTEWTVIFETESQFAVSPLNRVVFVKSLPAGGIDDLDAELRLVRPYLSTIALYPFTETNAARLSHLGASRLCALGSAQQPHPFWHQDGQAQLSPLVRWQDLG